MRFIDAPLFVRQIVIISFILTFVLSIIGLFVSVRLCKKRRFTVISTTTFVLSFISVFLTMRGSYLYRAERPVFEPSLTVIKLPLLLLIFISGILFLLAVFGLVHAALWNKKHISPLSIKESADTLPAGICFYEESGLVRLINAEMNDVCVRTTGKALLDGANFWQKICKGEIEEQCAALKTGDEPIIEVCGKVTAFKRYVHDFNGKIIYEIAAADVTKTYMLTKELEQKLKELKSVNGRLISYGKNVTELTREKELLAAKIRIHDDMGKLLLATKRKLTKELTSADEKELLDFWRVETTALKSADKGERKSNLQVITEAANLVGVNVEFCGELPKPDTQTEKILVAAIHECLTNAVSHANGENMRVETETKNCRYVIKITNDGEKPQGEIKEGGGLSGLRALAERENGKMIVKNKPQFELIIELPQSF